ncbi:NADH dehydrogenase [ubiquinone] 1 alpha subcomplex subunit [Trema orientale]|uniref:NADH dehydrogenase [ubiquinone] 1 alpha subcomplex subunit 12 n=1 Tax=Trema orientale TaxID=63057 RepID=A0A2P5F2G0_TREOI|nr:NADH dehydrogenase [ubiquinone] 1 alpha subcomplex subunit [Trema orientale]
MSKLFSRVAGFFSNRNLMGVDKAGNRYFARKEEIDGVMKEKRWVAFKGEDDPTSIPVEWICWLNGQRKKAPTPEEMEEMEARRERVRQNVARKAARPDLRSFIRQFPASSEGDKVEEETEAKEEVRWEPQEERGREIKSNPRVSSLVDASDLRARVTVGLQSQQEPVHHIGQVHGSHQHELYVKGLLKPERPQLSLLVKL